MILNAKNLQDSDLVLLREKLAWLDEQIEFHNYGSMIVPAWKMADWRSEVLKAIAAHTLSHFHDYEHIQPAITLQNRL